MKWVNIKEARLFQQWMNTTIASVTWKDLINFIGNDMPTFVKAAKELEGSELYNAVWADIQAKAEELVETKCKPEWNRISEEMKPIWEEVNKLSKEKAEAKEWEWSEENETKLKDLNKQIADLSNEYQKVTDDANAELNEYKDKRIAEEEWAAFMLEDDEYALIGWYVGF